VLYDSRVICEYLDSLHEGPRLFPPGAARWVALRQQAMADGLLDAALLRRYESLRPADQRSAEWDSGQRGKVERALDAAEREAAGLGEPVTIGAIAIACALGYLDLRFAADAWRQGRPALAGWYEAFAKRSSMLATELKDPAR